MKKIIGLVTLVLASALAFAQTRTSFMAHNEEVISIFSDIVSNDGSFFTVSKDGSVSRWNEKNEGLQYQVTDKKIKYSAIHPNKNEIAFYETDENTIHTISVWDCTKLTKKFSVSFTDSILSLTYSKKGTYIIIGTATENGTIFLSSSDGKVTKPVSEKMFMTSFVETANSEKSLMSYTLTGNIAYYSIGGGKLLKKVESEKGLSKLISFNKNRYIAGSKDKKIIIIDAMSGKKVFEINSTNPVFFNYEDELYYYDSSSGRSASIFKFTVTDTGIANPQIIKNVVGKSAEKITSFSITNERYLFGSVKGNIFSATNNDLTEDLSLISKDTRQKVIDAAFDGSVLLLLTNKTLYVSNEDKSQIDQLCGTGNQKNITVMKDKIIFWTQGTDLPVFCYNKTAKTFEKLFTPTGIIGSIKACGNKIIEIENVSKVNCYDFDTKQISELYFGTGIFDAVLINENDLYIAKTDSHISSSACLYVNTKTHETVPLKIDADHILAIETDSVNDAGNPKDAETSANSIYFLIYSENSNKPAVKIIRFNHFDKKSEVLHTLSNIDSIDFSSFLFACNGTVYNKVSGSTVSSVQVKGKKIVSYPRSYSLPYKVCADKDNLVTLNFDGGVSWYDSQSGEHLADWYVTEAETVLEY
ncbi:MAG: hypothetical protein KBS84_05085 [Treponema sp.]|nr:hypothetical protein [Candidatus Treponema scatequi]